MECQLVKNLTKRCDKHVALENLQTSNTPDFLLLFVREHTSFLSSVKNAVLHELVAVLKNCHEEHDHHIDEANHELFSNVIV